MEELPPEHKGWLAGLNDPQVGRALALLHGEPAKPWTVDELAREAGVSRSGLADRFTKLIGESPINYLTIWRMHLARQLLTESGLSAGEVATRVGYDSEYAFNRAFKRLVGHPPATWRKKTSTASV
jgi:AraC-like DNA-binding protein